MKRTSLAIAAGAFVVALCAAGWRPVADWWQLRTSTQQLAQSYGEYRVADYRIAASPHAAVRLERSAVRRSTFDLPASLAAAEARIASRLAAAPDDPRWLNLRGQADLMRGHHDEAIDALEHALDYQPEAPALRRDLGMAYAMRAAANPKRAIDYLFAIENLGQSLRKNPADNVTRFNYALALEQMFLYTDALNAWKEYLAAEPGGAWAQEARACQRRVEEKVAVRERALKLVVEEPGEYLRLEREGKALAPEFYLDVALRKWIPKSDSPVAREALTLLARRAASVHSDPWLRELLPSIGDPALGLLAAARQANAETRNEEALALVRNARPMLGSRAARVWADREEVVALHLALKSKDCYRAATNWQAAARGYGWFTGEALVERRVCGAREGELGESNTILKRAVELTQQLHLPKLGFRARAYSNVFYQGYPGRSWSAGRDVLTNYWRDSHSHQYGQQAYLELARVAQRANTPFARFILLREGAGQIARTNLTQIANSAYLMAADAAREVGDAAAARSLTAARQQMGGAAVDLVSEAIAGPGQGAPPALDRQLIERLPVVNRVRYYVTRGRYLLSQGDQAPASAAFAEARALAAGFFLSHKTTEERAGAIAAARIAHAGALLTDTLEAGFEVWQQYLRLMDGEVKALQIASMSPQFRRATLLTYVEVENRILAMVFDDRGLAVLPITISAQDLAASARRLQRLCSNPESGLNELDVSRQAIYDALVAPLGARLEPSRALIIQADGAASLIPWAVVLQHGGLQHTPFLLARSIQSPVDREVAEGLLL